MAGRGLGHMSDRTTFTGRARRRRTKWSVRFGDRFAAGLITVGGIGTIAAVSGVCLYLLWTVAPLFAPTALGTPTQTPNVPFSTAAVAALRVSDSDVIGWALLSDGELVVFQLQTGEVLSREAIVDSRDKPTAYAVGIGDDEIAIGFGDGTVRLGTVTFETSFLDPTGEQAKLFQTLSRGATAVDDGGVLLRTPQDQLRRESVAVDFTGDAVDVSPASAIDRLDLVQSDSGPVLLAWSADQKARLITVGRTEDLFTGEIKLEAGTAAEFLINDAPEGAPAFVGLASQGAGATFLWSDGSTFRFDTRNKKQPELIEAIDIVPADRTVTAAALMVGRLTLLVGDSAGQLNAWFPVRGATSQSTENSSDVAAGSIDDASATESAASGASETSSLMNGHRFPPGPGPVVAIAPSSRSREVAMAFGNGQIHVWQVTTETFLGGSKLPDDASPSKNKTKLFLPPGEGEIVLYATNDRHFYRAPLKVGYPEAGFTSSFRPIWYESYPQPRHVWQTSAGTNAAEPKLGLIPLVFGTLKATFYSMIFGVPIALLAALYTSEFLSKSSRARVKPAIEIMASLPSVVLGFLAAIVFAPIVEEWLPSVIAAAFCVPFSLVLFARVWQSIPQSGLPRWGRWRLPLSALALALGMFLAALLGEPVERLFFAGNVKLWLNGQIGGGFSAWLLLLFPISAIGLAVASGRWLGPILLSSSSDWSRGRFIAVDFLRLTLLLMATIVVTSFLAWLLTILGLDPRGTVLGTYVQRNALVVGFVMGFAIIPIIYTLADDALHAVPESLRSASLGAGATPWQTALRIVVPTAMSGLFSAIMVGLGRAVGETMIVLMAAGNMPIMEINIFNGFQTLSAAIATEMPEAVRGSAHFRTLFLAALVLFGLTFFVNTIAELVRTRFRRRVVQL